MACRCRPPPSTCCSCWGWRPTSCLRPRAEEAEFFYERAIDLLKAPTKSGYMCVTAAGKRWQAKVTARGHQVVLANCSRPRDAASEVLMFCIGSTPAPPSADKSLRNRRGEGRRPGSRHGKHRRSRARESPVTVTEAHLEVEVSDVPPAGAIEVPCVPVA